MRPHRVTTKAVYLPDLQPHEAIASDHQPKLPSISPAAKPVEVTGFREELLNVGRLSASKSLLLMMTITVATALLMSYP